MSLSVVVTAFNEEKNIKDCLSSVKDLASELIVVDNKSSDNTARIAKEFTDKIYTKENEPEKIDSQKNFGFSKATSDWILSIDADERVSEELAKEIKSKIKDDDSSIAGYWIPRQNIIFGKVIKSEMWSPDYQLRLFRRGKGKYGEGVHRALEVNGPTLKLENEIIHHNYASIHQYLEKLNLYTDIEVKRMSVEGYKFNWLDAIRFPVNDFVKTFFLQKGWKDGVHGLVLSMFQAFYMGIVFAKLWEEAGFPEVEERDFLKKVGRELSESGRKVSYWIVSAAIDAAGSPFRKIFLKTKRRISPKVKSSR